MWTEVRHCRLRQDSNSKLCFLSENHTSLDHGNTAKLRMAERILPNTFDIAILTAVHIVQQAHRRGKRLVSF